MCQNFLRKASIRDVCSPQVLEACIGCDIISVISHSEDEAGKETQPHSEF